MNLGLFHFEKLFLGEKIYQRPGLHLSTTCISSLSRTIWSKEKERKSSCQNICQLKRPLTKKSGPGRRFLRGKTFFGGNHFYNIVVNSVVFWQTFVHQRPDSKNLRRIKSEVSLFLTRLHFYLFVYICCTSWKITHLRTY